MCVLLSVIGRARNMRNSLRRNRTFFFNRKAKIPKWYLLFSLLFQIFLSIFFTVCVYRHPLLRFSFFFSFVSCRRGNLVSPSAWLLLLLLLLLLLHFSSHSCTLSAKDATFPINSGEKKGGERRREWRRNWESQFAGKLEKKIYKPGYKKRGGGGREQEKDQSRRKKQSWEVKVEKKPSRIWTFLMQLKKGKRKRGKEHVYLHPHWFVKLFQDVVLLQFQL